MFKLIKKSKLLFSVINEPTFSVRSISTCKNLSVEPVDLEFSFHSPVGVLPSSQVPIIILHGLLGSRLNWRTLANVIASKHHKQIYTLDARNHGDSPHSEKFDYQAMAADVCAFMQKREILKAIIMGHSMGGRTAMTIALTQSELVEKLVVVDVSPCPMPKSSNVLHAYILTMKDALVNLPQNISLSEARVILNKRMASSIPETSIRQFLLTNLASGNGGFKWKANINIIAEKFFSAIPNFPFKSGEYAGETLFICGGNSLYVSVDDHEYIRTLFPKASFVYIPGAGHWVHSEKPQEFLTAVGKFL